MTPGALSQTAHQRGRTQLLTTVALIALSAVLLAALPGCRGCGPKRLRRFGATCGRNSECVGGVCYQGRCTRSCKDSAECGAGVCIENVCHEPDADTDGDGLTNAFELAWNLDPAKFDSDGDGRSDGEEIGPNPDVPNDSNGDGVIDAIQSNSADTDGDCMVDAEDEAPGDAKTTNLPDADKLCDQGVCAGSLKDVKVVCRPESPTQEGVVFGCVGCGCQADKGKVPAWQPDETGCDHLDNDCDGITDEDQLWLDLPVGATCQVLNGACGQPGDGGVVSKGVVECLPNGKPGCSLAIGGSQSVAKPELCNFVDDDCDGQSDEGFSFKGTPVGGSCTGCGETESLCADGSPANPPVVSCNLSGTAALCGALPFANGFVRTSQGAPPPRLHWTAAWSPGWNQMLLYGGEVPTAHTPVPRADLWRLEPDSSVWQRFSAQPPGHRKRAALVWDKAADRMLLVGGSQDGEPALAVWSLSKELKWQTVSGSDKNAPSFVPPMPFSLAGKVTRSVIVDNGKVRRLLVFPKGLLSFWSVVLGGGGQWEATSTATETKPGVQRLTGAVRCVVADPLSGNHALALMPGSATGTPGLYRLTLDANGKVKLALVDHPGGPPDRRDDQCVLDGKGKLHVFGGQTPTGLTQGAWHVGSFTGSSATGSPTWQVMSPAPGLAAALARNDAAAAWNPTDGTALIAGGLVRHSTKTGIHRAGRNDVQRWSIGKGTAESVVQPTPWGRVGQATGRGGTVGNCIAGGLVFDLPDVDGGKCRVHPATDAWCHDEQGKWKRITDKLPPYAFGIGGVDAPVDRMILAGGYLMDAGGEVLDVRRLWRGGLTFDESKPLASQPKVSDVVRTLDLKTGAGLTEPLPGPQLAASAVAYDPVRRRLISFGGFDNKSATRFLWRLDLQKLTWKDLNGGAGPMLHQYGSVLIYDPLTDLLGIAGGIQHHIHPTERDPIAMQFVDQSTASTKKISECHGNAEVPMHMTKPIAPASFQLVKLPAWADPNAANPVKKLFRIHFSQPAFLPTLLDPIGRRGVIALPDVMPTKSKDEDGKTCPGHSSPPWTAATVQLRVALGQCAGKPRVFLEPGTIANMPVSMFMASTTYNDLARQSWVWGGLEADGTPSTATWHLAQACAGGKP